MLVEALYDAIVKSGHTVAITTEEPIHFGKVDVFIIPTKFGLDLHSTRSEIAIEIKGGYSLSLPQLFRYMIDNENRLLILWRIRDRQIVRFRGNEVRELLALFNKMIIARADRLLATSHPTCSHVSPNGNWRPNQEQIKETFVDFSQGVTKTLPVVIKSVVEALDRGAN